MHDERAEVSAPRVSVIVPVLDDDCPVAVLESLTYPVGLGPVEVLVTLGGCPARQRNKAVEQAQSELLYFVDDDSWVAPETLSLMVETLERHQAAALGGPAVTRPEAGWFERLVGEVMASPFGSGTVRARSVALGGLRPVAGEELVSCNLLMTRNWFLAAGGLDEVLYPGEDVDLAKKLRALEAPMYYHPEAVVQRSRRRRIQALAYQYYRYGQGRGLRFWRHARPQDLVFLLPSLLLLNLLLAPWLPPHGLVLYLVLAACESARLGRRLRSWRAGLTAWLLFPVQHLAYGWGMIVGQLGIAARPRGEWKGIKRYVLDL